MSHLSCRICTISKARRWQNACEASIPCFEEQLCAKVNCRPGSAFSMRPSLVDSNALLCFVCSADDKPVERRQYSHTIVVRQLSRHASVYSEHIACPACLLRPRGGVGQYCEREQAGRSMACWTRDRAVRHSTTPGRKRLLSMIAPGVKLQCMHRQMHVFPKSPTRICVALSR